MRCCEPATTTVRWRWWCRTDAAGATKQLAVHLAEQGAEFPVGASFPHLFFATAAGVVVIAVDPGDPDVMHRPPRDPKVPITNRTAVLFWLWYAVVVFVATLAPLVVGPDEPSPDRASASMTMTFVVMCWPWWCWKSYLPDGIVADNLTFYLALVAVVRFTVLALLWWTNES